jgi:ATP-binding cassette subfamily F protein uup
LTKGRKISAGQLLERFLFDRKKQYDFVEKLSGGEIKRLFLCTVLIQNPNFLILDEPTNDLDIVTLQVLEDFLLDFPGNLLVVSHDRYFMDKIVDHLFVFEGNGNVLDFPGNYSDYRAYEDSSPSENNSSKSSEKTIEKKSGLSYSDKKEFGRLENEIAKLEKQKKEIETLFAENKVPESEISAKSVLLQKVMEELELKENRWLEISMRLED